MGFFHFFLHFFAKILGVYVRNFYFCDVFYLKLTDIN